MEITGDEGLALMNATSEIRKDFEQVFRQHYQSLCSYAHNFLQDQEASEDLVQDVFIKIWESGKMEIGIDKIKFYLFTAVRNNCLTRLQKIKKNIIREIQDEDAVEEISLKIDDNEKGKNPKELVSMALGQLPPKCREVFMLSRLSGFSYRQIAESQEISVKTVENQMGKAISILKKFALENRIYMILFFIVELYGNTGHSIGVLAEKWLYK